MGNLVITFICLIFASEIREPIENVYMALGDYVMISPDLTQYGDWVMGQVIEVEDNSFVGTVISARTEDGNIFFGKAADFKGVA